MSKEAEKLGADVLSIITPSFAVASQKELQEHYTEVAKHVNTPIVLYNIPARTGNKLSAAAYRIAQHGNSFFDYCVWVAILEDRPEAGNRFLRFFRFLDSAFLK